MDLTLEGICSGRELYNRPALLHGAACAVVLLGGDDARGGLQRDDVAGGAERAAMEPQYGAAGGASGERFNAQKAAQEGKLH